MADPTTVGEDQSSRFDNMPSGEGCEWEGAGEVMCGDGEGSGAATDSQV